MIHSAFVSLMTATAVILMAVPECRHDDRLLRYSPVAAEIDGELYYSGEYVYPTIVNHDRSFIFRQEENGFYVYIERLIYSDSGVETPLEICIDEDVPFALHTKYPLGSENNWARAKGCTSTEGYVVFTEKRNDGLSGVFEFEASDGETGAGVSVTNGTFVEEAE